MQGHGPDTSAGSQRTNQLGMEIESQTPVAILRDLNASQHHSGKQQMYLSVMQISLICLELWVQAEEKFKI